MHTISQYFSYSPHLARRDVLDIVLVAALVYYLLRMIRGTRAAPMLLGVIALAAAFWVAHVANLRTLDWLLGTMLPYSIFALIVIFAQEIRHALARLGRNFAWSPTVQTSASDAFDDIVLAANLFS